MYDLDTEEGMANAVAWTNRTLGCLNEGGIWMAPRSGMSVCVLSHADKRVRVLQGHLPDPSIIRVLKAAGWTINK
jgi:hypothetical protein